MLHLTLSAICAAQLPTQATVDNGVYTWNLSYDTNLRLTENKVKQVSNNSTPFDQTRTFDNAGNVVTTNTIDKLSALCNTLGFSLGDRFANPRPVV